MQDFFLRPLDSVAVPVHVEMPMPVPVPVPHTSKSLVFSGMRDFLWNKYICYHVTYKVNHVSAFLVNYLMFLHPYSIALFHML